MVRNKDRAATRSGSPLLLTMEETVQENSLSETTFSASIEPKYFGKENAKKGAGWLVNETFRFSMVHGKRNSQRNFAVLSRDPRC